MQKTLTFSVEFTREDFDRYDKNGRAVGVPDKTPATMGDLRDAMELLIGALLDDLGDIAKRLPD